MRGFGKIDYTHLNARQKENYNFAKLASQLADFGFACLRLSDDWQGADLIACHIDGSTYLRIQLKGRLSVDNKYQGKDIHVAFCTAGNWYLYPHDEMRDLLLDAGLMKGSRSWDEGQGYSWPSLSRQLLGILSEYRVGDPG